MTREEIDELRQAIESATQGPIDFAPSLDVANPDSWEIGVVGNGGLIDWRQEIAMVVSTEEDAAAFVLLWNAATRLLGLATRATTAEETLAFIHRVAKAMPDGCDLWQWDGGQIRFFVNCSDTFWWGTADVEEITPDNIAELERAKADAAAAHPQFGDIYTATLFAARVRKMRPMKCAYSTHKELWPLFDACGPEREDDKTSYPERGKAAVSLWHRLEAAEATLAKVREILGPKIACNFWDDKASGDDCTASRITIGEARELQALLGRGE